MGRDRTGLLDRSSLRPFVPLLVLLLVSAIGVLVIIREDSGSGRGKGPGGRGEGRYPWHTQIIATTFWVGEIFDPNADDDGQVLSAYDDNWLASYGGCDGTWIDGNCHTEQRFDDNGWFPRSMVPLQNPFYLDLPYDDINDDRTFAARAQHIPWASQEPHASRVADRNFSLMKDRWVEIRRGDDVCFGQIEDAGPGQYDDVNYVFGHDDARPANERFGGAGMDVSPAINGCLHFTELNGDGDLIDWRFVDDEDVPAGPWKELITTTKH